MSILSGVGPVETAMNLTAYLADPATEHVSGVINTGIAGAYPGGGAELLDICLADREFLGDMGICYPDRIEPLDSSFAPPVEFQLDKKLLESAEGFLADRAIDFLRGSFVTVTSASGTSERGKYLSDKFNAICENMEGGVVSRVCNNYAIPCLEFRCVSNMVVDRDEQVWCTQEALSRLRDVLEIVLKGLSHG